MKKVVPLDANLLPDHAELVFKGKIFDVYQYAQKLYDGTPAVFEMLKRPDTVQVIAIVEDKIIVLEDEQPHRDMLLALPGGRVDAEDSSILDAAKRETHEETGYNFKNWRLINVDKPLEKIEWFIYTYIAWDPYDVGEPHIDAGEKIKIMLKSFKEVKALQENGNKRFVDLSVIKQSSSLEEIIAAPEFKGIEVDR